MPRRIVISADPYEARAALLDGDLLTNLEIESAGSNRRKGNIYKGRVTTVEKGLEAAFVDYGVGKEGFLPLDEVNERSLVEITGKSLSAAGHVSVGVGDIILVQVAREEVGKKGAALTMNVSIPGRFLVLMPFSARTGVSRKLAGDDRSRLKDSLDRLCLPKGFGCIIRTVGDQCDDDELQADLNHLVNQWKTITGRFREAKKPAEIHSESSLALRFVRDYMDSDVDEVIVEDETTWNELKSYFDSVMPGRTSRLTRYFGDLPLFVRFGVDRQVEALLRNRVELPSGGSIVIGQTEALTAIDVNSGRTRKGAVEETAYRTNLEAAVEIARQVILRDIGGIIVVDFIDMEQEAHRKGVEDALKNSLARDKARLTVTRIKDFGLLAFSRQRLRHTVEEGIMSSCPTCGGTGRIRAPGPLAMSMLRRLRERLANMSGDAALVEVTVSIDVANFLNNRKREELTGLEKRHGLAIEIIGTTDIAPDDMKLDIHEAAPEDRQIVRTWMDSAEEQPTQGTGDGQAEAAPSGTQGKPSKQNTRQTQQKERPRPSLLKGLLARLLDIDEFDEVPARTTPVAPAAEERIVQPHSTKTAVTGERASASAAARPSAGTERRVPASSENEASRPNENQPRNEAAPGEPASPDQPRKRPGRSRRGRTRNQTGKQQEARQEKTDSRPEKADLPTAAATQTRQPAREPVQNAARETAAAGGEARTAEQRSPDDAVQPDKPSKRRRSRGRGRTTRTGEGEVSTGPVPERQEKTPPARPEVVPVVSARTGTVSETAQQPVGTDEPAAPAPKRSRTRSRSRTRRTAGQTTTRPDGDTGPDGTR